MVRCVRRLLLLGFVGCSFAVPTPIAYVKRGPAFGQQVTPLAALPVQCGAATMGCLPGYKASVASATRIAIEFGGYTLVDADKINAELQRRTTVTHGTVETTDLEGRTWLDLAEPQQRELLAAMGIRGLLHATITMGLPHGMAQQRTVTVAVAISRLGDGQLVWQSECGVETGDFHSEPQAIDLATRCALESGTLWF